MPRVIAPISVRTLESSIRAVRAKQKPRLIAVGGVAGLFLAADLNSASWILRYVAGAKADGKPWRRDLGLGSYPEVPLAEAREAALAARAKLRAGKDPVDTKHAAMPRVRATAVLTFKEAARRLIASKSHEWRNAKHRAQWSSTLETYADPVLGAMPVDQIGVPHVLEVLTPIWTNKTETARRVRSRIEAVLGWAKAAGLRTGENPAHWKGNLEHLLPKPGKVQKKKNHPALPYSHAHRFVQQLRGRGGASHALEFLILTASRPGEVRGARWSEIDLDAATWTIPEGRTKGEREHTEPLAPQSVALLRALPRFADSDLVFPAPRGGTYSDATLAKVVKLMHDADVKAEGEGFLDPRQGRVAVPHGFRSTFKDWASECTAYANEVSEMALSHKVDNKTEAAYRRGDLRGKRAALMADWAKFIDTPPGTGNVTPIRRKA